MSRACVVWAAVVLFCLGGTVWAVTIDTVIVGDPGNAPDTRYYTPGYGSVGYSYRIGKYEITAGQYCAFLNAKASVSDVHGLYNPWMADPIGALGCNIRRDGSPGSYTYSVPSDWTDRPVNYVSIMDAFRFANWLHNGQGDGDTESGVYDMSSGLPQCSTGWKWAIASRDEWHKAAFYKGGETNAGYWDYATQSDIAPSNRLLPADPGNNANYYASDYTIGGIYYRTNVGEFENSKSAYGAFDLASNVWEMNDSIADQSPYDSVRRREPGEASERACLPLRRSGGCPTDRLLYQPRARGGWRGG